MTYRLLYNSAVAMTGGQDPEGMLDVPAITRLLEVEGVTRVVVTTPEPERYRGVELASIAAVRHRDDIQDVQSELAAVSGVTVLIHDDQCATEKRRLRKRGKLAQPAEKVWINQRVCEGCGDCGDKSSCLSVQPVATEFGRKTQIHQASCNSDLTCLKGDCPSFVMVTPAEGGKAAHTPPEPPGRPARSAAARARRRPGAHARRGRHRRGHRVRDPADGGPPGRPPRLRPRADRPGPEGRARGLRRAHLGAADRGPAARRARRPPT